MSEKTMRRRVIKILKSRDAVAVENKAYPGTPDVNFIEGWVELKQLENWPVREDTIVKIDHYTPQQRVWLWSRWKRGGNVWLLLQVKGDWLLFQGDVASQVVGRVTRKETELAATKIWRDRLNEKELLECLTSRN